MTGDAAHDPRFAEHLASAGSLVAGQRYDEAEAEVLRALERVPAEPRALNLLALVRFKLGRLDEARATYREIAVQTPGDPAVRRNLGLLALKAERLDEAVAELELAARLAPDDKRSWSYLGFAYTRSGEALAAAAAFRRAGQDAVADELEAASPPSVVAEPPSAAAPTSPPPPLAAAPAAADGSRPAGQTFASSSSGLGASISALSSWSDAIERRSPETRSVPMVSFVLSSLGLSPGSGVPAMVKSGAPVRLSTRDGAHVRADAVLASVGASPGERAVRRVRGRPSGEWLGSPLRPFYRLSGPGEVWVAGASNRWAALTLDEDILYVREDRVLAFDGGVTWEAGRIPGDGLRMLQFRGRGQVVLQLGGMPSAIRIGEEAPARVARGALLGWVGRVVAHRPRREGPLQISCEGDGVMLLETRRSTH
jgi:tetratricopeptide (TPR) repeat protein